MAEKARALYDFEAQPDSGELSLREGDVLTVTNKNVGDGWWEGSNSRGQTGFFPEAYIEVCEDGDDDAGPPSMAPPPLPPDYEHNGGGGGGGGAGGMGWSADVTAKAATAAAPPPAAAATSSKWDDDDNWGFPPPPPPQPSVQQQQQRQSWVGSSTSPGVGGGQRDPFSSPQPPTSSSKSNAANTNQMDPFLDPFDPFDMPSLPPEPTVTETPATLSSGGTLRGRPSASGGGGSRPMSMIVSGSSPFGGRLSPVMGNLGKRFFGTNGGPSSSVPKGRDSPSIFSSVRNSNSASNVVPTGPFDSADSSLQWAYDGEDWSSDEENFDAHQHGGSGAGGNYNDQLTVPASAGHKGSLNDVSSIGGTSGKKSSTTAPSGTGIISLSRFSAFVKIGGENFILGKLGNVRVNEQDVIQVVDNGDDTFSWLNVRDAYTCKISNSKKESKFGGLKSFIAYQLTPSFNNIQVSRRYKHFDWLHERLVEKYSMIPIPPLPDKAIHGRYEDEFIEHRMNQLQSFVDRVSAHPVLSTSEVWMHFLTCTDDRRWTSGKRTAEKDPLVGGSLLMTIKAPEKIVYDEFLDRQLEIFNKFHNRFDRAVKGMFALCNDQTKRYQTSGKQEYQNIAKAFMAMGAAMEQDGNERNTMLNNAVTSTGEAYEDIARITDEQSKKDWEPLGDMMHDYKGLLGAWPNVLSIHSDSVKKRKECERFEQEGKINGNDLTAIRNRADSMSYALMAEIGTFHVNRAGDVKQASQRFLREQIEYYQKITQRLQDALREFDSC